VQHWLLKSEPDCFSIDDLRKAKKQTTCWDGVRNYKARNFLRAMMLGDRAFLYHSSCAPPAVVGVVEIVREAYPDATAWDADDDHFDPGPGSTCAAPRPPLATRPHNTRAPPQSSQLPPRRRRRRRTAAAA
jgi:predicted RNA-binding protein with PUA-like domain